jgi:hypothetical protein
MVIYIQPTMNQPMKQMIHFEVANSSAVNCQSWTHRHTCTLSLDSLLHDIHRPQLHPNPTSTTFPICACGPSSNKDGALLPLPWRDIHGQKLEALPNQVGVLRLKTRVRSKKISKYMFDQVHRVRGQHQLWMVAHTYALGVDCAPYRSKQRGT